MSAVFAKRVVIRWLVFFSLVISLGVVINASSCNSGGAFKQNLGGKIDAEANVDRATANHKYVVDVSKRLYWPNKPKYANKIAEGQRAWWYDDDSLKENPGFKLGPL